MIPGDWSRWFGGSLFLFSMLCTAPAAASPWTLPQDKMAIDLTYDFSYANKEYLPPGKFEGLQAFPLEGEYQESRLALGLRYGFSDRFEGAVDFSFKQVSYESVPFFKGKPGSFEGREPLYNGNDGIFDFSETRVGAGDFHFKGRYNVFSNGNVIKLTSETDLKLPGGYEEPEGTFASDKPDTGQIADDVTLGDGQVDLTQSILFGGYIIPTRTFVRADAGYSLRFGTPGDQLEGGLKIGQNFGQNLIFFVGSRAEYTVTDGGSIGISFISTEPDAEPYQMKGGMGGNIKQIPLTLDKDFVQLEAGMIFRLDNSEVQLSYRQIVWGRNIPAIKTASVSTVFAFPNVTGRTAESPKASSEDNGS